MVLAFLLSQWRTKIQEIVTYERNPSLALDKRLQADQDFAAAGDTVVYELLLTNDGTTSLSALTITDELLGDDAEYTYAWDDSDAAVESTLEPGESPICHRSHVCPWIKPIVSTQKR